jgi:hypothetical protein
VKSSQENTTIPFDISLFRNEQSQDEQIKTNFENFYDEHLKPYLLQLEASARAYKNWKHFTIGCGILGVVFILLYQFLKVESGLDIALSLFIMAVAGIFYTTESNEKFIDDFKQQVIARILHHISPSAVYKPLQFLSKKEYRQSGLYRRRFTEYDGEDYWQASYDGVSFHCSELTVRYEDAAIATTIFKGLFITAVISGYYNNGTYIWTKGESQLPASMADETYRMYPLPAVERYRVEDEAFNAQFSVYSSNFSDTQKILTPSLLQKMQELKFKTGRDIVFSFVAGKCYVAIPMEEDLLEPAVKGLQNKESYKKYFFTFLLVFNMIRELELKRLQ